MSFLFPDSEAQEFLRDFSDALLKHAEDGELIPALRETFESLKYGYDEGPVFKSALGAAKTAFHYADRTMRIYIAAEGQDLQDETFLTELGFISMSAGVPYCEANFEYRIIAHLEHARHFRDKYLKRVLGDLGFLPSAHRTSPILSRLPETPTDVGIFHAAITYDHLTDEAIAGLQKSARINFNADAAPFRTDVIGLPKLSAPGKQRRLG